MVQEERERTQALTVRLPENEYQLLRTLAYTEETSINEVVRMAILRLIDSSGRRSSLESLLGTAKELRLERGQSADLPRNPHWQGTSSPTLS